MIWRKVTEFPQYSVSDSGLVRNDITGWVLKPSVCGNGYLHVRLHGKYNRLVHRLVAEEFVPRPDGADQVHHIDGNKHNNAASNLVWCNQSEHKLVGRLSYEETNN